MHAIEQQVLGLLVALMPFVDQEMIDMINADTGFNESYYARRKISQDT
jgi:hypothetical protein